MSGPHKLPSLFKEKDTLCSDNSHLQLQFSGVYDGGRAIIDDWEFKASMGCTKESLKGEGDELED